MKYRTGFISNSSSSSFVCDICGEEQSGWDMCLSDAEMYCCEKHHYFCEDHVDQEDMPEGRLSKMKRLELAQWIEDNTKYNAYTVTELRNLTDEEDYQDWLDEDGLCDLIHDLRGEVPEKFCPCCNLTNILPEDEARYLRQKIGATQEEVHDEIRRNYKKLSEF